MSSDFSDIEDVLKKANEIGCAPVLASLKDLRSSLHPDKNGGTFSSEEEKKRYHFLDEAVKQVELKNQSDNQLIPISQLPALIETITKTISTQNKPNSIELEKAYKESFRSELSRKYMGSKIGSGIFAAITGFLFTQASDLIKHPIVGPFFDTEIGMQYLIISFVGSIVLFVITWIYERREETLSNYLLSEEALRDIYSIVRKHSDGGVIETNDIRRAIRHNYGQRYLSPFNRLLRPRLGSAIIDKILEVQLQKLIDRKVIEVVDTPSIELVYRVIA